MKNKVKNLILKCFVVLFICYFCTPISFAIIWQNWRECANAPGCSCTLTLQVTQETTPTLKTYVVASAGYFLKSHDAYQEFLYCIEMSESNGIDSAEFKNTLYRAIDNMEKANAAYSNLKTASEKIPYNQEMIDRLMKFDYDGFRIKNGLNEPIFEKVKDLLIIGDIPGLDDSVISNMDVILKQLYTARTIVDKDSVPDVSILWRITQSYFEAQLFGQYMSEVFRDILF